MTEFLHFRNLSGTAGYITRLKVIFEASFLFFMITLASQKYNERKMDKMAAIFNSLALIIYIIISIIIIGYAYLYILILQASGNFGAYLS